LYCNAFTNFLLVFVKDIALMLRVAYSFATYYSHSHRKYHMFTTLQSIYVKWQEDWCF